MLHWPSSGGAFAASGAALPAFGVGGANAWPISARVNTSLSGTGAGMTCANATQGVSERPRRTKTLAFMTLLRSGKGSSPEQSMRIDDEFLGHAAVKFGVPARCLIQRDDLDIDGLRDANAVMKHRHHQCAVVLHDGC